MKRIETQNPTVGITEDGKVFIGENYTHSDYLELLEATSENIGIYNQISSEMDDIIQGWDWETAIEDGNDISRVWEERDWFELQVESALEDENLDRFGDY